MILRLIALLFGHERFVWRLHFRAYPSNREENLQLSLYTSGPESPARGPDLAREGFQSDPRAFLELFCILAILCK